MTDTRGVAEKVVRHIQVETGELRSDMWASIATDSIRAVLRQRELEVRAEERERVVTRFMAIVKDIKGPNVPRVDLYEAMLAARREILRRDGTPREGEQST